MNCLWHKNICKLVTVVIKNINVPAHHQMDKYIIEHSIGISPPFLKRCFLKNIKSEIKNEYLDDRVCCSVYFMKLIPLTDVIDGIEKLYIRGYQENQFKRYNNIDICLILNQLEIINFKDTRIVTFNCFDKTVLYISSVCQNTVKLFYCSFYGCHVTRKKEVFFYEIILFEKLKFIKISEQPAYRVDTKVINIKSKNKIYRLHYNWNDVKIMKEEEQCSIELFGRRYMLDDIQCIFCFNRFLTINNLNIHIDITHLYYKSSIKKENDDKILVIRRVTATCNTNKNFGFRNKVHTKDRTTIKNYGVLRINQNKEFEIYKNYNAKEFRYTSIKCIEEIIDTSERTLNLMKRWNDFMIQKKVQGTKLSSFNLIKEFVISLTNKEDVFDIITLFYHKHILSKNEVFKVFEAFSSGAHVSNND